MSESQAQSQPLEVFFPEPVIVEAGGEAIAVRPIVLGQLGPMCRAVAPFIDALPGVGSTPVEIARLIGAHAEAVIDAMSIATGRPVDFLAGLPLDSAAVLAATIVRVNLDFFVQRVAPRTSDLGAATTVIGA